MIETINDFYDKALIETSIIVNTDKSTADRYNKFCNAIEHLKEIGINDKTEIEQFIRDFNKLYYNEVLSPLSLFDNEFEQDSLNPKISINKRYPYITKYGDTIMNNKAFNCNIIKYYNHKDNVQLNWPPIVEKGNHRVYISKGGVITGEYIEQCFIRPEVINKHSFTIQSIISIPVSKIINDKEEILVVDCREPKLRILKEFYSVPVKENKNVKSVKYNIRNYTKLK